MQEALRKMSLMPAQTLEGFVPQIKKKGRLQEGMDADIVVFDPATVSDVGTYEQPKLVGIEGLEAEEPQHVKHSTRLREAFFVDFAIAMQEKVSVPLMATGGFRTRAVIEQAVKSGAADLVGLGRPMCVDTDAPRQLLAGADSLERYEDRLRGLPAWLSFLERIAPVKVLAAFSVMYWYYAQIEEIAKTGKAKPGMGVFSASLRIVRRHARLLKQRPL